MLIKFLKNLFNKRNERNVLVNHIYKDSEEKELVYLGKAFFCSDMVHNTSPFNVDDYKKHVYVEKNVLDEYATTLSFSEILSDLLNKYCDGNSFSIPYIYYSEKPLKVKEDLGICERNPAYGDISFDSLHMIFNFDEVVFNHFN